MSRPLKFIAWFIAAMAALFAVVSIAFLFLFDANDFKENLEKAVLEETGRELVISGDVSLQIFPWLAVEVGAAQLGNAPGFGDEPFAAFDSVTLSVRLLPLFSGELVVGTAAIDGLLLNLEARNNGTDNWSDLAAEGAETGARGADAGEVRGTLAVSGFAASDATINYTTSTGTLSVSDAYFTIGPVTADNEMLSVGALSLEALVTGMTEIPTNFSFDTDGIVVDRVAQSVTVRPIDASILGIDMRADVNEFSYADAAQPTAALRIDAFSPRSVMTQLGMEPLETADPSALSKVSVRTTATIGANDISLANLQIELDDTTFTGSIRLPMAADGRIRIDLGGDVIDLNRYMAPAAEEQVDADADAGAAPIEIPVEAIRLLNALGNFRIATVRIADLELENATLAVEAGGGRLRMHPISADLYGGSYKGDVRIDASGSQASLSLNETVDDVDLAQLAEAMFDARNITGSIAGNFKLGGRGNDTNAIRESLSGTMSFELSDGTYEGVDVWYELRRARAKLRQETPPEPVLPARTRFSSITASGVVKDGVMRNDDFLAKLPFMQITGAGDVNLVAATVNYGLQARVFSKPELMSEATPAEIDDLTKTVIPLRITGPLGSPKVAPDVEALLRKQAEDKLKEKVEDKLKDLFKR